MIIFSSGLSPMAIISLDSMEDSPFRDNFMMNFRSGFGDNLLSQILRISEMDRGRTGTPPAAPEEIKNLPEIQITEEQCKKNEQTGELEYPRCTICFDDLKEKGTLMPCGHLFNKECITSWLEQHNQCPVCREELRTNDAEYERRKQS
jgi:E3 ubiquitin-protein ligase RNF115/126